VVRSSAEPTARRSSHAAVAREARAAAAAAAAPRHARVPLHRKRAVFDRGPYHQAEYEQEEVKYDFKRSFRGCKLQTSSGDNEPSNEPVCPSAVFA